MCECWKVPPISPTTKRPFYSNKPALLAAGSLDPACRPLYIDMIHHYMANSQRLLFTQRSQGVLGGKDADAVMKSFLDNPHEKIKPAQNDIIAY